MSRKKRVTEDKFADGWPDAWIVGLHLVRTVATPRDNSEKMGNEAGTQVDWNIYALPAPESSPGLLIFGDLRAASHSWVAGGTSWAMVRFRDPHKVMPNPTAEAADELAQLYGPWASHVLYDYTSAHVTQVVASMRLSDLEIPKRTPPAEIVSGN